MCKINDYCNKNGINTILDKYEYPELCGKIGIDEGENVIMQGLVYVTVNRADI
jgi:hypothetical protein